MKKNPLSGGLRHGSGRGKKGWYKGYWCDSTWELAWVIYQLDNGKVPVRNKGEKRKGNKSGSTHCWLYGRPY